MTLNKRFKSILMILLIAIIATFGYHRYSENVFDEKILNIENIMSHIETLSSYEYEGRLAGSIGNQKALSYIESYFQEIGLQPAGTNNTFLQPFSIMMPQVDSNPIFEIIGDDGNIKNSFEMFSDYSVVMSPNGGGIDFEGEYIVLGSNFFRVNPSEIKDRIAVIISTRLTPKIVSHIMASGGKGVLCSADSESFGVPSQYETTKNLNTSGKTGDSILVGYISEESYQYLESSTNQTLKIKVAIDFPIIDTANILGKIEGQSSKKDILLISTNFDGLGMGVNGKYFPGAINNTAGMAIIMELARVMSNQENLPYDTVVFAGWNGQKQQLSGSAYYINHALYPLENTAVLHLESIGKKAAKDIIIASDPILGTLYKDKIRNYAWDAGLTLEQQPVAFGVITQFSDNQVPSVLLTDGNRTLDNNMDQIENIDVAVIEKTAKILTTYIKREIYKDLRFDYLSMLERMILLCLALGGLFSYLIGKAYTSHSGQLMAKKTLETLYFSTPIILLRKFYNYIFPYILAVFMLVLLANTDPHTDMLIINGKAETNMSLYLIFKKSLVYLLNLLDFNAYNTKEISNISQMIYNSSKLSIVLVSTSLILSTILGILRGMYEGFRAKKSRLGSLGTLVFFSIPDVLIVLFVLLIYTMFAAQIPTLKEISSIKAFFLPLLTLSIIPTTYISRITLITIQDELTKDYIKNEKAKGFSRQKIIFVELLPAIIFRIVDAMPTIVTMLLSNMIIVEYLFNYHGILYFLIYLYNRQDVYRFVPLILTLGFIYIIFTKGFQWFAKIINPMKRKGA
ncbi:MAG: M28 family peptidase [Tissierellales bacterium]|nr:M28 family peptidase [Tissierellales bacterium]MBN2826636.1 M28 family peptidase [Tissierellales bacterium]